MSAADGLPSPDCTGTYTYAGQHNGVPYWTRNAGTWILWWSTGVDWRITNVLGGGFGGGSSFWDMEEPTGEHPTGTYTARDEASGDVLATKPMP